MNANKFSKMKTALLLFFVLCTSHLCAQQVISTGGASFSNGTESISWTLGEVVTETMEANNGIVTHGFHQTRLQVSTLEKSSAQKGFIRAYPNPVHDFIFLHVHSNDFRGMQYTLYNSAGLPLQEGAIRDELTKISFIPLPPAMYFIKITKDEKFIRTFKIIKTY